MTDNPNPAPSADAPFMIGHTEAARMCGVGMTMWYSLVASGKTPRPTKLGRRVLWVRDELEEWCRSGCPGRDKWEAMCGKNKKGKRA